MADSARPTFSANDQQIHFYPMSQAEINKTMQGAGLNVIQNLQRHKISSDSIKDKPNSILRLQMPVGANVPSTSTLDPNSTYLVIPQNVGGVQSSTASSVSLYSLIPATFQQPAPRAAPPKKPAPVARARPTKIRRPAPSRPVEDRTSVLVHNPSDEWTVIKGWLVKAYIKGFPDSCQFTKISTKTKTSSIKKKFWNFKKANWISFENTIIKAATVSIPRALIIFSMKNINMKELAYALENTDLNKTPGPDGIHGRMISNLGKIGKERLLNIFNNYWKTGKLLQDCKNATIFPI
ncbi:hypothetical protein LAZ67_X004902 [Cordylochernes scorpioides]|uniref:Uncharacterized protein n=1 Tax=Cordylochernes scorpioides TaxID=51811 RepID=A0ABY6LVR4_9ARAC|nr:hypothetical protein LAZ67_X004902 [Cordylochernes scorpioides]